jgi:hypothetical protein
LVVFLFFFLFAFYYIAMSQSTKSITSVVFKQLKNMFTLVSQDNDREAALTVVTTKCTNLGQAFHSVRVHFKHSGS